MRHACVCISIANVSDSECTLYIIKNNNNNLNWIPSIYNGPLRQARFACKVALSRQASNSLAGLALYFACPMFKGI